MKSNTSARTASNIVRVDFRQPRVSPAKAKAFTFKKFQKSKPLRELLSVSLVRDVLRDYR